VITFFDGLAPVFQIGEIFLRFRMRILGSAPLTNDPNTAPDPALFVSDLQDANEK
jgi:hypothetical protein